MCSRILSLFLFAWGCAHSGIGSEPRLITTTGDAEVRVVPDEVILTLGVETSDKDLKVAKDLNDQRVKKVLAVASDFGIDPKHVQTDHVSIEPRYRDHYERRDFLGYFVRKSIVITLKDISQFEDLLTKALEAEVNYVHGIQFRTTELRKHRDEARALAIRAAREKAVALGKELEQSIGAPHSIHENASGWWSGYNAWWGGRWRAPMAQNVSQDAGGGMSSEGGSLAVGQITVNARVTVSFFLEE